MHTIPVVDLSALERPGPSEAQAQARQLDLACRRAGVFEVVGHGISRELQTDLFAYTREFFRLPDVAKAVVSQPAPDQVRGWSALGSEGVAYSLDEESPADLKEKLDMGPPSPRGDAHYRDPERAGPHLAPNLWPAEIPALQDVWHRYFEHMERIGNQLMMLTALASGLPADWFIDRFDKSVSMLRALHYPEQPNAALTGQLRAGVHSDYGAFTIIMGEEHPGGLEVLDRSGAWMPVATAPGRLIVLLGDLLAEWTADVWPSTLHRVVNPLRGRAADSSRLAFAFYQEPNYDLQIDILPPYRVDGHTPLPPFTAGEHLREKYLRQTTFGRDS